MSKITDILWSGLKKRMSSIATTFAGRRIGIEEIPSSSGEIGFTSSGGAIHLSRNNEIINGMKSVEEQTAFVMGVFAHELMHQLITDFCEFEKTLQILNPSEAEIFKDIYNVMEDPAIEAQAKYYIGGDLLANLHYSVMTLYKQTEPLKKGHPMSQLISALIMYGDGGFVKGRFYSAKARKTFQKILPIVDKTIDEPNGKKRVQYAYEVFLMTKPLWADDVAKAEEFRKLMEELRKNMAASGKKNPFMLTPQPPVNPERNEDANDPVADKKKKRRKITFRKVSKEELEQMKKSGAGGEDDGVSDIEVLYCDEDDNPSGDSGGTSIPLPSTKPQGDAGGEDPTRKGGRPSEENKPEVGSESSEEGSEGGDISSVGNHCKEKGSSEKKAGDSESKTCVNSKDGSAASSDDSSASDGGGVADSDGNVDYSREEVIDDIEYELTADEISQIAEMLADIAESEMASKTERDLCHADNLEVEAVKANYAGASCLNKRILPRISSALEAAYNKIITTFSANINRLTSQMKRIINNDRGESIYRSSGRVHVPRLCNGRKTTNVFRRNIDPANKADMCVLMLIDESGSMGSNNKSVCAMQCTVCLAEVLSRLHIPLKVIGFTADVASYDVVHNHYMHWLNTYEERLNLTSITHRVDNFDGYSIRYATEMLRKRPEEHKLLIIMSDGQPAARYYKKNEGVADTIDAIKCAKKSVDVIGVGIGTAGEKVWKSMYGSSFLHVKDANDLLSKIGGEIQKIMKRW